MLKLISSTKLDWSYSLFVYKAFYDEVIHDREKKSLHPGCSPAAAVKLWSASLLKATDELPAQAARNWLPSSCSSSESLTASDFEPLHFQVKPGGVNFGIYGSKSTLYYLQKALKQLEKSHMQRWSRWKGSSEKRRKKWSLGGSCSHLPLNLQDHHRTKTRRGLGPLQEWITPLVLVQKNFFRHFKGSKQEVGGRRRSFSVWRHATLLSIAACGDFSSLSAWTQRYLIPSPPLCDPRLPSPPGSLLPTRSALAVSGRSGALMCWMFGAEEDRGMSDPSALWPKQLWSTYTPCMTSVLKCLQLWRDL